MIDNSHDNNGTHSVQQIINGIWDSTAAITSVQIAGNNMIAGSRISVYTIKNT